MPLPRVEPPSKMSEQRHDTALTSSYALQRVCWCNELETLLHSCCERTDHEQRGALLGCLKDTSVKECSVTFSLHWNCLLQENWMRSRRQTSPSCHKRCVLLYVLIRLNEVETHCRLLRHASVESHSPVTLDLDRSSFFTPADRTRNSPPRAATVGRSFRTPPCSRSALTESRNHRRVTASNSACPAEVRRVLPQKAWVWKISVESVHLAWTRPRLSRVLQGALLSIFSPKHFFLKHNPAVTLLSQIKVRRRSFLLETDRFYLWPVGTLIFFTLLYAAYKYSIKHSKRLNYLDSSGICDILLKDSLLVLYLYGHPQATC